MGKEDNQPKQPWWGRGSKEKSSFMSWTWKSTLTVGVFSAITAVGLGAIMIGPQFEETSPWVQQGVTYGISIRPTVDALAAQCGPIYKVQEPPEDIIVGTVPDLNKDGDPIYLGYFTTVPIYGIMSEKGVDTSGGKVYWAPDDPEPPRPEQVLRSLWDGWMVAYYTPGSNIKKVEALGEYAENNPELKMLVIPWPKYKDYIPNRKEIAYATWGAAQQCVNLLNKQVRNFRAESPEYLAPGYKGDPPKELTYEDVNLDVLKEKADEETNGKTSEKDQAGEEEVIPTTVTYANRDKREKYA